MIYKLSLSKDLVVNFKTSLRDNYCVKSLQPNRNMTLRHR